MTKVSYVVKINGRKGGIKVPNYTEAIAKAEKVGGYVVTTYTKIDDSTPLNANDFKRIEFIQNGGQLPKATYR